MFLPVRHKEPQLQVTFSGRCTKTDFGTLAFHLSSPVSCAIFFRQAEVQVPWANGWTTVTAYPRYEVIRLQPNVPYEFCVDSPRDGNWRILIRFGTEMKGIPLLRAQMREAWNLKSLSNWTGKAWGGGRFIGEFEMGFEGVEPPKTVWEKDKGVPDPARQAVWFVQSGSVAL